ncbi:NACHT domain-containing protein [Salinimicrobium sp. GXAS 041]|uniref:NACHT domain-containing protein n=1 Tax=Salinimicrobium sp. GXAS 041 TaxID=3400806 RepID=UPI003C71FDD4
MTLTPNIEITGLIKPLVDGFKAVHNEWDNFFEIGLTDYLHSQTEKYYFTNTFLHRSEKVRFNDIYFPIKATYKKLTTDFNDLDELFTNYNNITIIGSAGSGKTTLIKHIFLQTIFNQNRIPILIELRNLNEFKGEFEKLITEKILKSKVKPSDGIFKRALESGKFLFLLDGYDEIFSDKKQDINRQIELFVDSYSNNKFLITTRPGSGIEGFPRFYDFKVCPLDDDDVIGFISKIVEEGERKDRIKNIVLDPKNQNYYEFLRNPLLLSMFIMAFENHPEIPKRKTAFYRNVFDTLYSRHDGITKNSFPREKLTNLQRDDFEDILSIFSYLTLIEGQYSFTNEYMTDILDKVRDSSDYEYITESLIYDLRTSISILILDGFEYFFPHRSMQEYFTALFINRLPTDKKHKAYKNLSSVLQQSSTDYSFNFWSLCFEMDETIFISNFLIPQLKKIYKPLENKKGKELVESYFKIINPTLWKRDFNKNGTTKLRILRHANFQNAILDFCEIYDYNDIWMFPEKRSCEDDFIKIYDKQLEKSENGKSGIPRLLKNDELLEFLVSRGIDEVVENIQKKIENKIHKWDMTIKKKKSNIDDLLNI